MSSKLTGFKLNGFDIGNNDYLSKDDIFVEYPDFMGFGELLRNGTLWSWGYNQYGGIGDGTSNKYSSPIQIGTSNKWRKMFSGNQTTFGLKY